MIVVDSSAMVDALLERDQPELRARLEGELLHAPALLPYEYASALRGLVLGRHVSPDRVSDALADFHALPVRFWEAKRALQARTLQLRDNLTAYDASYVALAEALECPLVTRDGRLARSSGHDAVIELF